MRGLGARIAVALLVAVVACTATLDAVGARAPRGAAFVRVSQLGFTPDAPKQAFLMSARAVAKVGFAVDTAAGKVALRGRAAADQGRWNGRFAHVYTLDLSRLRRSGRYRIVVPKLHARSPLFRIASASDLYAGAAARAVTFFRAQRDGAAAAGGPLDRQASHLLDASASVFSVPTAAQLKAGHFSPAGGPANVAGGWFDAGDYLKFVETSSFATTLMLWTERDHPGQIPGLAAEARVGIDWLEQMYDPQRGTLLYQVGIGDGNGDRLLGDHDLWRLPQRDDHLNAKPGSPAYYVQHRPVFAAGPPGAPISPNLAGRMAAAFGLCAQVFRASDPAYADTCLRYGEAVYAQARTSSVGTLLTASPHSYYPETSWRDDIALGATELYLGLSAAPDKQSFQQSDPVYYIDQAGVWADRYAGGKGADLDSMNLYDVEALTDYDLARALVTAPAATDVPTDPRALAADLRDQLRIGATEARHFPFRLADPNTWADSVSHALGYSISAQLYDRLAHTSAWASFGQHQLDWVLGANPWGSSFVVGTGTTFPRCLQHQVANLAGSRNGRPPLLLGATVGGPVPRGEIAHIGAPDGYRRCPVSGGNAFGAFNGQGAAYRDDVRSAPTSEPTDDATALALLAFAERL